LDGISKMTSERTRFDAARRWANLLPAPADETNPCQSWPNALKPRAPKKRRTLIESLRNRPHAVRPTPTAVVLFGSIARGDFDECLDIDLVSITVPNWRRGLANNDRFVTNVRHEGMLLTGTWSDGASSDGGSTSTPRRPPRNELDSTRPYARSGRAISSWCGVWTGWHGRCASWRAWPTGSQPKASSCALQEQIELAVARQMTKTEQPWGMPRRPRQLLPQTGIKRRRVSLPPG